MKPIKVLDRRYGSYIKYSYTNISMLEDTEPEKFRKADTDQLIEEKETK